MKIEINLTPQPLEVAIKDGNSWYAQSYVDSLGEEINHAYEKIQELERDIERLKADLKKQETVNEFRSNLLVKRSAKISKLESTLSELRQPIQDREVWVEVTQDERETCRDLTKWVYTTRQNWIKPVKLSTLLPNEQNPDNQK